MNEIYLGDGLYAKDDGYQVELYAYRADGRNWVALDDRVLQVFMQFLERSRNLKILITKNQEEHLLAAPSKDVKGTKDCHKNKAAGGKQ